MAQRIGILGGTFDPIHVGHLAIAEASREECGLDRVLFMPACVPVFKLDQYVTPVEDRLAMVELAVASNPSFEVSTLELERGGYTYTADTLRQMKAMLPDDAELWFIVGGDAAVTVPIWHDSDAIAQLAHLVISVRPGTVWPEGFDLETLDGRFHATTVEAPQLEISSSMIRAKVAAGRSVRYLVPEAVNDYILEHGLYREDVSE